MSYMIGLLCLMNYLPAIGQGFISPIDNDNISVILNQECIVKLASGDEVKGVLKSASLINGYLSGFSVRLENGEKAKFKPADIEKLSIKASKLAKLTMMAESTGSIKEMTNTNFDEIVNRQYIVYLTAMRANNAGKLRLMQLLNPGFDSKIQVYADPNAKETKGIGMGGIKVTGGVEKSYLFVENNEKAVLVKKGKYKKSFDELYANCPKMLSVFEGEKTKWNDAAGHVFAYDQSCK